MPDNAPTVWECVQHTARVLNAEDGGGEAAAKCSGAPLGPGDLLDRLALDEALAPNPRNRFHDQHSLTTRFEFKREACNGHTSGGHF